MRTLQDLFLATLKDVYYAERQILKALPKMARAAEAAELREAFETHRAETQQQIERLQQVFELLNKRAQGATCEAINGIIEEADELLEQAREPGPVRDAGLIAAAQAVEHYEMARYGSLVLWSRMAERPEVTALLEQTLAEEKATEAALGKLAKRPVKEPTPAGG
jgi:ferritin-like metal-binding protein YciE